MMTIMFFLILASTFYAQHKMPNLQISLTQRILIPLVGAVFYPITLTGLALIGGGLLYHNKVKALPFVTDLSKRLPNKANL